MKKQIIGFGRNRDEEPEELKPEGRTKEQEFDIIHEVLRHYDAATNFGDSADDTHKYNTNYFLQTFLSIKPDNSIGENEIYDYLKKREFRFERVPGGETMCWLVKLA